MWKGRSKIGYDGERERGKEGEREGLEGGWVCGKEEARLGTMERGREGGRERGRESWARDSSLQKMEALLPPAAMAVLRRSPFPRDNILGERAAGEK